MEPIIKVENLSKQYRLGTIGTGTLSHDINRWWHTVRGKEDPYLKISDTNDRTTVGDSEYVWALKDINFEVNKGEILGIIGMNGAGKSTLLKLLSRVTAPTTGKITCHGRIASLLEVGTGFHPELTGRENIFLNGAILGMTKKEIKSKFDEIVDFAGCEKYIETPVKRYSSGMYVRLAFAVAAHLEPDILVVDEVLAVGDAEFQKKAIGKMQEVSQGQGRTVLFVSHNMGSITSLCNRGIVLEKGKVVFEGLANDCVSFYMSSKSMGNNFNPTKRHGTNQCIKNIVFKNERNEVLNTLISGQKIMIEVELDCNLESPFHIGIGVYSQEDKEQFSCSTETFSSPYPANTKKILLNIDRWPLGNGNFYLSVYLSSKNTLLDHVLECVWIKSETGDYYETGILPQWNIGFYIDYKWA